MRKVLVFLYVVLLILGFVRMSKASLTIVGDGDYVYDDIAKIWWWANLETFTNSGDILLNNYDNQISYIEDELGDGWHMAKRDEIEGLATNSGQDIIGSFIPSRNIGSSELYYGRYDLIFPGPDDKHYCAFITGNSGEASTFFIDWWREKDAKAGHDINAWVCTETNPVPIPGAVWLLGSGLIGIVGVRRKIKK